MGPPGRYAASMRWELLRGLLLVGVLGAASIATHEVVLAGDGEPAVLVVAADGSGDHATIAAALEAAPEGGVVRIGAGVFEETLTITRSVTLVGAGTGETTIIAPKPPRGPSETTLAVSDAPRVTVSGLRLMHRGDPNPDASARSSVVEIERSEVTLRDVVVAGGAGNGVFAGEGARLTLEASLVARTSRGVSVHEGDGARAEVTIRDTDFRGCVYCGIQIGSGDVLIEGCRISGASWHGIRYDHCSPTIRGNLIFENARSGIYASGWTRGRITGNLFLRNAMNGVSCWSGAKDLIEGNTFVGPTRECVAALGPAHPDFRRNVFADAALAVRFAAVASRDGGEPVVGRARIEDNVGWKLKTWTSGEPEGSGWRDLDPAFVAPEKGDYSLPADSPLRAEGIGAADPPSLESPWPGEAEAEPPK